MSTSRRPDRVRLDGMQFTGHHGVSPEERRDRQRIEVDVALEVDLTDAGRSDDLALTVDYTRIHALVRVLVEDRSFRLLEAIAEAIAGEVLAAEPAVRAVEVRVRKPGVRLGGPLRSAGVEIHRQRPGAVRCAGVAARRSPPVDPARGRRA
jgi:dihydroneopterin aldolase